MSLQLMKERIKQSGTSLYEEQIQDAQDILNYGFQDDVSYNPNIVSYKTKNKIPIKMYNQKFSSSYGITTNFLTTNNKKIELGNLLYDTAKNEYWLCIESYNVSNIHNEGKLGKCSRFLKWQDENGLFQETPIIVTPTSKYNNGESSTNIIQLGSDQLLLFMQLNEDTVKLDRGTKFFIDENKLQPSVYELTRIDTALYTYMGKGVLSMIVTECAYSPTDKELELGVCNYKKVNTTLLPQTKPDETAFSINATISGNKNLKCGFTRTYTVNFTDESGNKINWEDVNFDWNVLSNFDIEQTLDRNTIKLLVEDESLINSAFLLQIKLTNSPTVLAEIEVAVVEGF